MSSALFIARAICHRHEQMFERRFLSKLSQLLVRQESILRSSVGANLKTPQVKIYRNIYLTPSLWQSESSNDPSNSHQHHENIPESGIERARGHQFIPMTRRTICRKLLEDSNFYTSSEHLKFHDLVLGIDTAISRGFYGILGEIKTLYDPLNPDKETIVANLMSSNERLDNEFWLLQKLSKLLEKAHFYELPREQVEAAMAEHSVFEGVLVSVDPTKYDVLRFWVLGEESAPVEMSSSLEKLFYYSKVLMKKAPKNIQRYKRVVLAVRTKKQNKLMLKSFKDIPTNSLEYLLPEGKIRMTKYDKGFIATTMFIGLTSGVIKVLSSLANYNIQWTYIAGLATGLLALRAWNAYKNKRNLYLMNLSKLLYFKTVANNRALLALIVDRAQDESYKSAILTYTFLKASSRVSSEDDDPNTIEYVAGMTAEELKESVENWMQTKYKLDVEYQPDESMNLLKDLGILSKEMRNGQEILQVLSLDEALRKVPSPSMSTVTERDDDFDFDQIPLDLQSSRENANTVTKNNNDGMIIHWK